MSDVTQLLEQIQVGDRAANEELLRVVYDELRRMAAAQMAHEQPGQTLQPTALVHEAYLKLVGDGDVALFANRRHFFGAAAEAMRRILIDAARRKQAVRHGGQIQRVPLLENVAGLEIDPVETLAIEELLDQFASAHPRPAELVKLRLFLQLNLEQISQLLNISTDTAQDDWTFARAWLKREWSRRNDS